MRAPSDRSRLSSSSPKNGAYGDVQTARLPPGTSRSDEFRVRPEHGCGVARVQARPRIGRHVPRGDDPALRVANRDRACADDRRRRLEDARCDLFLRLGEGEQAGDRLLDPGGLGRTPRDSDEGRRREAEQERGRTQEPEHPGCKGKAGVLVGGADCEQQCHDQADGGDGQEVHSATCDGRLAAARNPQPPRRDDREDCPVNHEGGEVEIQEARPRFARLRDARQEERPDHEDGGEREERVGEPPAGGPEGGREPEEEVGEEHEEGDRDSPDPALGEVARVVRHEGEDLEQPERAEGRRRPHRGAVLPPAPEDERDHAERSVGGEVHIAKGQNRVVQIAPPSRIDAL